MAKDKDTLRDEVFELASNLRRLRLGAWAIDEQLDDMNRSHPNFKRLQQEAQDLYARQSATESLVAAIPAQTFKDATVHVMMAYSHVRVIEENKKEGCEPLFDDTKRMLASTLRVLLEYTRADLTECDFEQYAPSSLLPQLSGKG